ncbi:MAG: hypothetical protein GY697_10550 [Desulfobacterales bacterium]|nr:hypothetical protein [Desulfobacterales bacterium]
MLDITQYRLLENQALTESDHYLKGQTHNVDRWQLYGFPVRLKTMLQMRSFIDSMHYRRFDRFMAEMGGLTDVEQTLLLATIREIIRFQRDVFGRQPAIIPYDALLANFVLYRKLVRLKPDAAVLLDIGPGSGLFAFFLRHLPNVRRYVQVEAAECVYLLQHHINTWLFKDAFHQACTAGPPGILEGFDSGANPAICRYHYREISAQTPRCFQYPWWKLGRLFRDTPACDLIMSNANLCEMQPDALTDYLSLATRKLKPEGFFVVHCFGGTNFRSNADVLEELRRHRLAPVFAGYHYRSAAGERQMAIDTGIFVGEEHPWFKQLYRSENYHLGFSSGLPLLDDVFDLPETGPERRIYTRDDLSRCLGRIGRHYGVSRLPAVYATTPEGRWTDAFRQRAGRGRCLLWGSGQGLATVSQPLLDELPIAAWVDPAGRTGAATAAGRSVIPLQDLSDPSTIDTILICSRDVDAACDRIARETAFDRAVLFRI